ncbi:MAG: glycosyltransferase family 4 protein [Verrucomicrobia bacterium]|nr:glycosyltransferase family 4 protein [Verrucomicrobiota bacterium]
MKIAYIHQYFNTPEMSGSTRSYEIATGLARRGHQVAVVTTWREQTPAPGWTHTSQDGVEIHWLRVPYSNHMGYGARLRAFGRFALGAGEKAAGLHSNVVYATSTPLTVAIPGIYCARRKRIPMVFEVRDLWPEVPIKLGALKNRVAIWMAQALERAAYRNADHVIALSPDMAAGVRRVFPQAGVTVIPNFCHDINHLPSEWSGPVRAVVGESRRPVILYAGTIGLVNNIGYMLRLAQASRDLGHPLAYVVVGDGREAQQIRSAALKSGVLNGNFFMLPPVPKRDMKRILATAEIATSFVLPEPVLWANSANKIFDGLAAGRPIAINHGGWLADLLTRTGAGLVLPPDDTVRAAQMLNGLIQDSRRLKEAQKAALGLARSEFDPAVLVDKLELILTQCISRREHAPRCGR